LHYDFIRASEEAEARRQNAERKQLELMAAAQTDRANALAEREVAQKQETEQTRRMVRRTLGSIYTIFVVFFFVGSPHPDLFTVLFADRLPTQHPSLTIVAITDDTLADFKARLPIDRQLLAKLVDAIDAAGAAAIGIDILFYRTTSADDEEMLIHAIRRAKAKVVLAAADKRAGISQAQLDRQLAFLAAVGRPAGFANLSTERDWVVRFRARPAPASRFPKSFAELLVEAVGSSVDTNVRSIAWLGPPKDGSDAFLTIPAEMLLRPAGDPQAQVAREALKGKIVIIGGLLPDVDQHVTPLTRITDEPMPGTVIHAHIAAQLMDGRNRDRLIAIEAQLAWLGGILIAATGFVIGWRYRLTRRGILWGRLMAVAFVAVVLIFQERYAPGLSRGGLFRPGFYVLLAMLIGELSGHNLGRLLRKSP
jgi:CHASE2 domain-containing sensor protein